MDKLAELTIGQLLTGGFGIVFVLSVFIEIVPVKFCPITSALKWLGGKLNGELTQKVSELTKDVAELDEKMNSQVLIEDERDAIGHRIRILAFGDEIRHGINHSKESFDQALSDIDIYNSYCKTHPEFKNNKTCTTTSIILETYKDCLEQNNFL